MIVDAILLIAIFAALHLLHNKYPDLLFLPKGAVLFLPPQSSPSKKQQPEVAIMKVNYKDVKDYPFSDQYSRVQITTQGLAIFMLLRVCASWVFGSSSMAPFYVLLLILIYAIKLSLQTFLLTNYNKKHCILFAITLNFLFYLSFAFLHSTQGVYDQTFTQVVADYQKHLQIVFRKEVTFFTPKNVMMVILSCNFALVVSLIPNVIRLGNFYAKTLKELYHQEEQSSQQNKETRAKVKLDSKKIIWQLNSYMVGMLIFIFMSHKFISGYLVKAIVDCLRTFCMAMCVFFVASTTSKAIQFNGSFAYKYVMQYFQSNSEDQRKEIRKKIVPYIYYIWYHYFQHMVRAVLPLLLFLLVLHSKYLHPSQPLAQLTLDRPLHSSLQCTIHTDQLSALQNLYTCGLKQTSNVWTLSGVMEKAVGSEAQIIQKNISQWGLLRAEMLYQFFEQLLWYTGLSLYLMTIVYIVFLRKTVYQL